MIGALLAAAGYAANAYGQHQGIAGLQDAKRQELQDQERFDAQRQQQVGNYLGSFVSPGMAEGAYGQDQARIENAAVQPAAQAGAAALGIRGRSPISAASRLAVRQRAMGSRLGADRMKQMQLDAGLGDIEHQRELTAYAYPGLEEAGARRGQLYRQMGSLLGAGGQAVNTYETMNRDYSDPNAVPGADPNLYSNNAYATNRPQGPSRYTGRP